MERIPPLNTSNGTPNQTKNGVLRKLKHIFPNTYQRIKSIRSPAKVGLVVTDLITSPVEAGPSYLFFGKY